MGEVRVAVVLENLVDMEDALRGLIDFGSIRRFEWSTLVDTGASTLFLPLEAAEALGVRMNRSIMVEYADGSVQERPIAENVAVIVEGRRTILNAIVNPAGTTALLGQLVLEGTDLLVDCGRQRLVPRHEFGPQVRA